MILNLSKSVNLGEPGINFCTKQILKLGIILMGIRLGLSDMVDFGIKGLIVVVPCILSTFIIIKYSRKFFNLKINLATLIAVGTSVCGATAIVATAPLINAKREETAFAIANITIFGLIAMMIYPIFANFIFSENTVSVGLFLGSSIHETAQVFAASTIYSDNYIAPKVVEVSTVTKLVRNSMLIFVIPFVVYSNKIKNDSNDFIISKYFGLFPLFIFGFVFFVLIRSMGDFTLASNGLAMWIFDNKSWNNLISNFTHLSKFFLTIAMAGIGMSINYKEMTKVGYDVFLYGLTVALFVGFVSFSVIFFTS